MRTIADTCNRDPRAQQGLTLIELMIAMALGLFVVLAATGLLLSSKAGYTVQDQIAHIQETGRYAMEIIARATRQAGHENWDGAVFSSLPSAELSPTIIGLDAVTLKKTTAGVEHADVKGAVNGSDVLALRFFGDETASTDGTILNCAGLAVAAPTGTDADAERGWSIFFVGKDAGGEPELRCKYRTKSGWNADAIARGVESFQVLYGIDVDADGLPDRYASANAVDALDAQLSLDGENAVVRAAELNRKTHWKKIRAIRIAMLIRGTQSARDDAHGLRYDLFGALYANAHATNDKGVRIEEGDLSAATRNRIRKLFEQTIQLRNDAAGSQAS